MNPLARLREYREEVRATQDMKLGWEEFPPLPESSTSDEVLEYLGGCRLASVAVDADRITTVALRDHTGGTWLFRFEGVELFCDTSHDVANKLEGDQGIWDLQASEPFTRDGRLVRLFMLEGNVSLSIYAPSVVIVNGVLGDV